MLDEPSLGLAPLVVREIFRTIAALRATGVTILLVEQNARAALEVADHGYVLEMGEIALEGPAAELAARPARDRDLPRRGAQEDGSVTVAAARHVTARAARVRPRAPAPPRSPAGSTTRGLFAPGRLCRVARRARAAQGVHAAHGCRSA